MALPLHRRDFDLFISHSHTDAAFALDLERWLTNNAGLQAWLDAQQFAAGSPLATGLQAAIERCRGALLIATNDALKKGWVLNEYNAAMDQRANFPDFRVIALRVANADPRGLMQGVTWIDLCEPRLDAAAAEAVLNALYPNEKRPNPAGARDVYVSCSWREADAASARAICNVLVGQGFRLIGDALDQKSSDPDRIARLIASCGALVAVLPFRDETPADAQSGPYKYFIREIEIGTRLGIPVLVIADARVRAAEGVVDKGWLRLPPGEECTAEIERHLQDLWDRWQEPAEPAFAFLATDLASPQTRAICRLVERVTGMAVRIGTDVPGPNVESAIMREIGKATLVLGDLTDDNVNVCIEVGMAMALGRRVEMFARGPARRPPFMLRSLQMPTYQDDAELLALVHRLVRPYRRRIINAEL